MVVVTRSPLAPARFPRMPAVPGVTIGATAAGVKHRGRLDLCVIACDPGTTLAGVYTRSATASAPVDWCRSKTPGRIRGLVVNSGNANAFTGTQGAKDVRQTAKVAGEAIGCRSGNVLVASTGVIGEPLPIGKILGGIPRAVEKAGPTKWLSAARAISTTDTFPKGSFAVTEIGGRPVTIAGIAKGSGMIQPNMATMLAFIFSDARIPPQILQALLVESADRSFHAITVDSDTSTSDSVLLASTGKAGNAVPKSAGDRSLAAFRKALEGVMVDLAVQVVRDGEGASKLITIDVTGARSDASARRVGLCIANSPLVKTAIAGEDANWGRVVMAVGKSGEEVDPSRLQVSMGGETIAARGARVSDYDEGVLNGHLRGSEIAIGVDLGVGRGHSRVWTCDLTHDYIRINAEYRT